MQFTYYLNIFSYVPVKVIDHTKLKCCHYSLTLISQNYMTFFLQNTRVKIFLILQWMWVGKKHCKKVIKVVYELWAILTQYDSFVRKSFFTDILIDNHFVKITDCKGSKIDTWISQSQLWVQVPLLPTIYKNKTKKLKIKKLKELVNRFG